MNSKQNQIKTDNTKLLMIEAAIEVFGRDGFHGASNRELANTAGVNLALISYHFGGKDGLYLAVFKHIAEQINQRLEPMLKALTQEIQTLNAMKQQNRQERLKQCTKITENILFAFIEMLASQQTAPWAKLILMEQQTPTDAFNILYSGPIGNLLKILTQTISIALGKKETHREAKLFALSLIGQIQILRSARATVKKHMGWQEITAQETEIIKNHISMNIKMIFNRSNC